MTSAIPNEELIEKVQKYPVLYDQSSEQYRNSDHKEKIWKIIAIKLNLEGHEDACKRRWTNIRDGLRKARSKRKTNPLPTYKYESLLDFLIPHLTERKVLNNVQDAENYEDLPDNEPQHEHESQLVHEPQLKLEPQPVHEPQYELLPQNLNAPERAKPETQRSDASISDMEAVPAVSFVSTSLGRKRKLLETEVKPQTSEAIQLMAYILAEKEAELKNAKNINADPIGAFLDAIKASLKKMKPERQLVAKGEIFNIVQKLEFNLLQANSQKRTRMNDVYGSSSEDDNV